MTLRHLRIYTTVYEEMSITRAAQKLHLAQPSVSLAIKELEEAYQMNLFDRINRRLAVTSKGIAFYDYAKHIVDLFDEMEHTMSMPDRTGSLHIGSSITIGNLLVPDLVEKFHKMYSGWEIRVTIQNSRQIVQAVMKNEQDIGLVEDKVKNEQLITIPFMEDQLYFLCGCNHPLAGRKKVSLEEMCEYPFYLREPGSASREIISNLLKAHQLKGKIPWESVSNQTLLRAIEKNPGITVMSARLVQRELEHKSIVVLPFHPDVFQRQFSLIYHKKKYLPEPLKYLIRLVQNL